MPRKRPRATKGKSPTPPAPTAPPARPAPLADPDAPPRDREGRPIRAGALIVEHAGSLPHPSFGRVIAAAGNVLLYRSFPGNESFHGETDDGSAMYADAVACSVIEDPPPLSNLPPVAAAALDAALRLAAVRGELQIAAAATTRRSELDTAASSISDAMFEMIGLLSQHIDDAPSATDLADAIRAAERGGSRNA